MSTPGAIQASPRAPEERERVLLEGGTIALIENHDRAYELWQQAGVRQRTLLHIDAHHDMWWADNVGSLSIANFISLAIAQNLVREIYWVVPDATWSTSEGRAAVGRHLRKIQDGYPGTRAPHRSERRRIRTSVMDRPLVVCSLDSLPRLSESVLLDIDVDYLLIPQVTYGRSDAHSPLPWRWPDDLLALLSVAGVTTDFVTIATSVDGGHTPLQWKYLGAELALRLRCADPRALKPFVKMRAGATAQHRGDLAAAEAAFLAVGDRLGAAPYFWLAYLLASCHRGVEGRTWYQRAMATDPAYQNLYSSPGTTLYFAGSDQAEKAFERSLVLDPDAAPAHLGLGWIAADRKSWHVAEALARKALACSPGLIDAQRLLARVLEKQARLDEAIACYEQSLKLALAGGRPYDGVIASRGSAQRLLDCDHPRIHARLGRLYRRKGRRRQAIVAYQMSIAGGFDIPGVRFRLAWLYALEGRWDAAARHAWTGTRKTIAIFRE
jgi:tetratricopeptide (TPR) repeat protein